MPTLTSSSSYAVPLHCLDQNGHCNWSYFDTFLDDALQSLLSSLGFGQVATNDQGYQLHVIEKHGAYRAQLFAGDQVSVTTTLSYDPSRKARFHAHQRIVRDGVVAYTLETDLCCAKLLDPESNVVAPVRLPQGLVALLK